MALTLPSVMMGVLWLALTAYVLLGGADFGGGVWDLFAFGKLAGRQREAIAEAMGPVWEVNHVWLIFLIVGLFTCFPGAFVPLSIALVVPFTFALAGIVLRGAAFAFRAHGAEAVHLAAAWGQVFGVVSVVTPVLFGMSAGAIAAGRIRVQGGVVTGEGWIETWTSPLCWVTGLLALALCGYLAAVYLAVEKADDGDPTLRELFRRRAIVAGVVGGALALVGLLVARADAPLFWSGLSGRALPLVAASVVVATAALVLLLLDHVHLARALAGVQVAGLLWAWGVAQYPYLIVPNVTVTAAASPQPTLVAFLVATGAGMVILLPSLWLLFRVFKGRNPSVEDEAILS